MARDGEKIVVQYFAASSQKMSAVATSLILLEKFVFTFLQSTLVFVISTLCKLLLLRVQAFVQTFMQSCMYAS